MFLIKHSTRLYSRQQTGIHSSDFNSYLQKSHRVAFEFQLTCGRKRTRNESLCLYINLKLISLQKCLLQSWVVGILEEFLASVGVFCIELKRVDVKMERRGPETMSHSGFIACEQIKTSSLRESPVAPTIRTIPPAKLPTTIVSHTLQRRSFDTDSWFYRVGVHFAILQPQRTLVGSFNRTQVAYDQNFELNAWTS